MNEDEAVAIVNDWFLCFMAGDEQATVSNLLRVLRGGDGGLDELRAKVSGWHFAKEAMTPLSLEILAVAEDLLRRLDGEVPVQ